MPGNDRLQLHVRHEGESGLPAIQDVGRAGSGPKAPHIECSARKRGDNDIKIGIIGAGQIGATLVRRFTACGHGVKVANSRGPQTLTELARETGAKAVTLAEAVKDVNLIVVTNPEKNIPTLGQKPLEHVPADVVIVDTGNYYRSRAG